MEVQDLRQREGATSPVVQLDKCISIDMMTSPTVRLVTQMLGKPTCKRYWHATIYVNQATGLGFIWLQQSINLEDTMDGKIAFKRFCKEHGITIQNYHADNGIFASNSWRQSCLQQGQGLTFAGGAAHHQNGITERWIRELQEMMSTMLIYAHHRWPSAITPNLWPYALRMANKTINVMPNLKFKDAWMPIKSFTGTKVASNPKHQHSFRCTLLQAWIFPFSMPASMKGDHCLFRWEFNPDILFGSHTTPLLQTGQWDVHSCHMQKETTFCKWVLHSPSFSQMLGPPPWSSSP